MSTTLPKVKDLLQASFTDTKGRQKDLWKLNLLGAVSPFVVSAFFVAVFMVLVGFGWASVAMTGVLPSTGAIVATCLMFLVAVLAVIGLYTWYGTHYQLRVLSLLKDDTGPVTAAASWEKTPGTFWVGILQGLASLLPSVLILAVALGKPMVDFLQAIANDNVTEAFAAVFTPVTFLGLLVAFILSVYLGTRLVFAKLAFIQNDKRGLDALKWSWDATAERFWAVFGRLLVLSVVAIAFALGTSLVLGMLGNGGGAKTLAGILSLGLEFFLLVPFSLFFQTRLFKSVNALTAA